MIDQGLQASFIVGVAVLAYVLGILSLFLLRTFTGRPTARGSAAERRRSTGATWSTNGEDAVTDRVDVGPVLYAVHAESRVAHIVRFAQEVSLCGQLMPDRFVTLRSSTSPAGTEPCVDCCLVRQGWASAPER